MKMLDSIDDGTEINIFGDGSETYDFVSVFDCARANVLAMQSSLKAATYNVGTGVGTTLLELATLLKELTGSDVPIRFRAPEAGSTVRRRVACTTLSKNDLGFEATISLRDGLKKLIAWRRAHIDGRL